MAVLSQREAGSNRRIGKGGCKATGSAIERSVGTDVKDTGPASLCEVEVNTESMAGVFSLFDRSCEAIDASSSPDRDSPSDSHHVLVATSGSPY